MVNVCGVTFDHTVNYGSCLQAYALKTAIEKLQVGGESCHYDLLPLRKFTKEEEPSPSDPTESIPEKKHIKNPLIPLYYKVRYNLSVFCFYGRRRFSAFEDEYMTYADCHSRKELPSLNDVYDAFVCGSDVIWNFNYTNGASVFFLDFATKYAFSYAVSFGVNVLWNYRHKPELSARAEDIYRENIPHLRQVGIREAHVADYVRKFTDSPVVPVCDPVFLLKAEEWERIAVNAAKPKKYIFFYTTETRDIYDEILRKIKKDTGLPVIKVAWLGSDALKQRAFANPTPQEWIDLIKNAEYVVTNSYHGTLFSIIFRKKFYTMIRGKRENSSNNRFYPLMEILGLSDRVINEVPETIDPDYPDYDLAHARLDDLVEHSLGFVRSNLEAAYQEKQEGH